MKVWNGLALVGAFYVSASYAAVDMSVATSVDLASSYVFRGATLNKKLAFSLPLKWL